MVATFYPKSKKSKRLFLLLPKIFFTKSRNFIFAGEKMRLIIISKVEVIPLPFSIYSLYWSKGTI